MRRRSVAFAVLATGCLLVASVSVALAVIGAQHDNRVAERAVAAARPTVERVLAGSEPFVLFRTLDRRRPEIYGRIGVAPLGSEEPAAGGAGVAGPSCSRIAFAAGRGVCLDVAGPGIAAIQLDARLQTVRTISLAGIPSRVRLSPDGRWAGVTAFIAGHAYSTPGKFSTEATVLDLRTGRIVGDLEHDFRVSKDGDVVTARDRNYWGITFAPDGDTFYATLATGGSTWLIKGSIRARSAVTIHENVECPAISPDGTRIGYKRAIAHDPSVWRFTVLDLASGRETPLAETRSVDDQLQWLDDERLLYAADEKTYVVAADGSGAPRLWLPGADSPVVVRPPA